MAKRPEGVFFFVVVVLVMLEYEDASIGIYLVFHKYCCFFVMLGYCYTISIILRIHVLINVFFSL